MPPLQDDHLRNREDQAAGEQPPDVEISAGERAAFDQLAASHQDPKAVAPEPTYTGALPEFDPNKRLKSAKGTENNSGAASQANNIAGGGASSSHTFSPGGGGAVSSALQGGGVTGGAAALAKLAGSLVMRNKKKVAAGGITAGLLISAVFYGGSLGMVFLKKNAEKRLDSISQTVFEEQFGRLMVGNISLRRAIMSGKRLNENMTKVRAGMERTGYVFNADGSITTPPPNSAVLRQTDEVADALKVGTREHLPGRASLRGYLQRRVAAKKLTRTVGVPTKAAVDTEVKPDDDPETVAKKNLREGAFDTETESPQAARNGPSDDGDTRSAIEAAEGTKEELADGTQDVVEGTENNLPRAGAVGANLTEEALEEVGREVGPSIAGRVGSVAKSDVKQGFI